MIDFWKDKRVLITGHSGFKGGWLSLWLSKLGAQVWGLSLYPPSYPNLFTRVNLPKHVFDNKVCDLRNLKDVKYVVGCADPDIIFHLAAQPLVLEGYKDPIGTIETNALGTAHLLEAAREVDRVKSIVIITTDKVYADRPREGGYTEDCILGGFDPYACSKACAEHIVKTYANCFLQKVSVSTVRAGNVIGGGDWGMHRLVPDCIKAFQHKTPLEVRNPSCTRPWQFVLEPLFGYMEVAEAGYHKLIHDSWNFGPPISECKSVEYVSMYLNYLWNQRTGEINIPAPLAVSAQNHETENLEINSAKALIDFGWKPIWPLEKTLQSIVDWYTIYPNAYEACMSQIEEYENDRKRFKEGNFIPSS